MSRRSHIKIERMRYWQGQKLRAKDFRDQTTSEAELRWWHNRALHATFGISYGLHVSPVISDELLAAVNVECGVAYDCYGRELTLQTSRQVAVPVVEPQKPADVTLLAHYRESRRRVARRSSIEAPVLSWKPSGVVERGDGVPLVRLRYDPSAKLSSLPEGLEFPAQLKERVRYDEDTRRLVSRGGLSEAEKGDLLNLSDEPSYQEAVTKLFQEPEYVFVIDGEFRARMARALTRPRIGRGETVAGDTPWELWEENIIGPDREVRETPLGVQVTIDTSAAGFIQTPAYFAWLQGSLWNRTNVEFFPVLFGHIDNESITGFRFRLWMPRLISWLGSRARFTNAGFDTAFLNFARQQRLCVCWIGVECLRAPEPACVEVSGCCCVKDD